MNNLKKANLLFNNNQLQFYYILNFNVFVLHRLHALVNLFINLKPLIMI